MPGNTKSIVKDFDGRPSPQYFNALADLYEYLLGRNGAAFAELLGPDGNPIGGTPGTAHPGQALLVAGSDGTNLQRIKTNALGQLETALTGRAASLVVTNADQTDPVAATTSEVIDIFASAGHIARIHTVWFSVQGVPGATTGTHRIIVGLSDTLTRNRFIEISGSHTSELRISVVLFQGSVSPSSLQTPADLRGVIASGLFMGASAPDSIQFFYSNDTDATQTSTREITIRSIEEAVI